ncbi:MAG TPA: peptidyl-prolyl cis-trans isomerase [Armatimonadota bacterium]
MKNIRWAILGLAAVVAGCSPSKQVVSVVNGKEITKDELTARLMQGPAAKATLRGLMLQALVMDAAAKQGITVTDDDVNQLMQFRRDQFAPQRFDEANAQAGNTDASMREDARTQIALQRLAMKGSKVSDESITKYYNADKTEFVKPEWRQVGFIVAKDKADADNAISAVKSGADFATVAEKFCIPQAKQLAGQYQWYGVVNKQLVNEQKVPVNQARAGLASIPSVAKAIEKTPQGKAISIPFPGGPAVVVLYVKTVAPGGKLPLTEAKSQIAFTIASKNNEVKPTVMQDIVKAAKVDVKMDQFKELAKPEVLFPSELMGGSQPPM